jgi:hypothetical protein
MSPGAQKEASRGENRLPGVLQKMCNEMEGEISSDLIYYKFFSYLERYLSFTM